MGLIKAAFGAAGGTFADQWKEFFYCDALDKDVLVVRGQKRTSGRSSNTKGHDNVISSGSGIAVADGQCMIIVEQGQVVEVCAEPGEFTYDASTEPSIFADNNNSIMETFETIGRRFTFGGDTGRDQRVYYFNMKELVGNKFGTPNPIPFRVVDSKIGLDIDVSIRCSGIYSYRIADPLLFYSKVCGNVEREYTREELDRQLKAEFISALQPAFGRLSAMELRPNQIVSHNAELEKAMNEALSEKWGQLRGLEIVSIALGSVTLPEEDAEMIKQAQRTAMMRDPSMAAAALAGAQADAMKAAAANSGGAMNGFMGMGMAMNAGGINAQDLFAMGQQASQQNMHGQGAGTVSGANAGTASAGRGMSQAAADSRMGAGAAFGATGAEDGGETWKCACGAVSDSKFCPECGAKRPEVASHAVGREGWICACGAVNKGKFCTECGGKKPAEALLYRCDKCGWEPEDPANPPKFCPECGDPFDERDIR